MNGAKLTVKSLELLRCKAAAFDEVLEWVSGGVSGKTVLDIQRKMEKAIEGLEGESE